MKFALEPLTLGVMSSLNSSLETLQQWISFPSVSSTSNAAVSAAISQRLQSLGFQVERTAYFDQSIEKVNLVACRRPLSDSAASGRGGVAYFCHTDVVPADNWTGPGGDPFAAVIQNDRVYGRGSCDMKGSLVSMLTAIEQIPIGAQTAPLWVVCTADEEVGFSGAKHLVAHSAAYRDLVQHQPLAIIGEPTRLAVVHAHKGITGFRITSRGRAAHSSTTGGINANEAMVPMLQTLLDLTLRTRSEPQYADTRFDPPLLSWNFGVSDGGGAINVTPGRCVAWVSLRTMPEIDGEDLIAIAQQQADDLGLEFERLDGGAPVWVDPEAASIRQLCQMTGQQPTTVCYGTDGGEFAELENRVILGPGDIAQAHTTDEWISLEQLQQGTELYRRIINRWCVGEGDH